MTNTNHKDKPIIEIEGLLKHLKDIIFVETQKSIKTEYNSYLLNDKTSKDDLTSADLWLYKCIDSRIV